MAADIDNRRQPQKMLCVLELKDIAASPATATSNSFWLLHSKFATLHVTRDTGAEALQIDLQALYPDGTWVTVLQLAAASTAARASFSINIDGKVINYSSLDHRILITNGGGTQADDVSLYVDRD